MSGCGVTRTSRSLIRSPGKSSAGRTPLLRYTQLQMVGYSSDSFSMRQPTAYTECQRALTTRCVKVDMPCAGACHPDLLIEVSDCLQGDGKRELEYRAGDEHSEDGKEAADEEQPQKAEAEAPGKQPEAELPLDDQDAAEDGEGPMNEQARDGAQQQDFTTPEACTRLLRQASQWLACCIA